jgi:hypothetical protein
MERETKKGNSLEDVVREASCGPQFASDIDKSDCGTGKCKNDSKVDDLVLVK